MAETDSLVGVADERSNDGAFVGKLRIPLQRFIVL